MTSLGIRGRLLFSVFLLIAATALALGFLGIRITRGFIEERFEDRILFLARNLAVNSEIGILLGDTAMLKRLAGNLILEKDILGAAIFDKSGRELASAKREDEGGKPKVEAQVVLKEDDPENRAFRQDLGNNGGDRILGRVAISYDTREIDEIFRGIKVRFALLSAGIAAIAGFVFYLLSRSLVAPVSDLASVARRVAGGDESVRAAAGGLPETRELATAFNTMLDSLRRNRLELEEANREVIRKSTLAEIGKFSMMVAHEVKNPLSIIKTSFDLLKERSGLSSEDTMVFYIEDEIRRLNKLIEDFLSFARPTNPVFREVDLNAMFRDIAERFDLKGIKGSTRILCNVAEESCMSKADPDLLARALSNIIKNAVEASSEGGNVYVSSSSVGGIWKALVEDEGEGIRKEDLTRIFEPFFTTRSKGTGLGLAYAMQVIRAHGGNITAENRSPRGAVFRIEVPLR
jgi:signal transduction histidine kinase